MSLDKRESGCTQKYFVWSEFFLCLSLEENRMVIPPPDISFLDVGLWRIQYLGELGDPMLELQFQPQSCVCDAAQIRQLNSNKIMDDEGLIGHRSCTVQDEAEILVLIPPPTQSVSTPLYTVSQLSNPFPKRWVGGIGLYAEDSICQALLAFCLLCFSPLPS